jgi:hypothetical protein
MAQVFKSSFDLIFRLGVVGLILLIVAYLIWGGPADVTAYGVRAPVVEQPLPFVHQPHIGGDGIDCRYCHYSVEESSFAGLPPTEVCMTCHSQIYADAPALEPLRESFRSGQPIRWNRVNDLPDFVYFNHSIHIRKGIGCVSCHGRVDRMPLTWQAKSLEMQWCLNCHNNPAQYVRPRSQVFNMDWQAPQNRLALGRELVKRYHIKHSVQLTDCSTCHR